MDKNSTVSALHENVLEGSHDEGRPDEAARDVGVTARLPEFATFSDSPQVEPVGNNLGLLMDVGLEITVELGRARMAIRDVLNLSQGSIIELDRIAGEPVNVLVNGVHIAFGEVVVIDEQFGVRITEIVPPARRTGLVN